MILLLKVSIFHFLSSIPACVISLPCLLAFERNSWSRVRLNVCFTCVALRWLWWLQIWWQIFYWCAFLCFVVAKTSVFLAEVLCSFKACSILLWFFFRIILTKQQHFDVEQYNKLKDDLAKVPHCKYDILQLVLFGSQNLGSGKHPRWLTHTG